MLDDQLEVLVDLVITDDGEMIPTETTLAWFSLASAQVLEEGRLPRYGCDAV